jgi:hypothetical protein
VWLWHKRGSRRRVSLVLMGIIVLRKRGGSSIWKGEVFFFCWWIESEVGFCWVLLLGCELWLRLWKQCGNMDLQRSLFGCLLVNMLC